MYIIYKNTVYKLLILCMLHKKYIMFSLHKKCNEFVMNVMKNEMRLIKIQSMTT